LKEVLRRAERRCRPRYIKNYARKRKKPLKAHFKARRMDVG
jgi:hypothetical protein